MTYDLLEDFRTVTEVKANLREVLGQIHRTRRPVIITVKGKPDAVLVDVREFERQTRSLALLEALAEGERDALAGRLRPARDVLADLEKEPS